MSSLLYAELAATCNALGYFDGNKYYIDTHCQETIKDLIRYLRRDDENHEIRRYIGESKILQADLLPILKDYWEKADLFDVILRLLVNLTNPALLLYREELPADKTSRNYYLQIIAHLQSYKEAFCDHTVWALLSKKLGCILQIDSMERDEDKGLVIERILILVRNVLQVPADPEAEKRTDNDASIHDQVLWALQQSGMIDLFLYIACSENEQQYYMHILEIVSLMLREQNPTELADAAITRSVEEKERDEVELIAIRQEEIRQRQAKLKKFTGARHSRFGGTYVLKDMKSVSDNDIIYHKPLNKVDSLDFDQDKTRQKMPKNRMPMKSEGSQRRSAFSIRLFLREFCVEFLNGAYNTLMYHVKDGLVRAKAQANDESYYMWAMKFFMEFNRNYKFQVKLVSETMSVQTFHYIQTQLENCYDMLSSDKKKMLLWSRRMHLALRAYKELLMTLTAMDKSDDSAIRESSKIIKNNIFYVVEYRELILTLLLNFDEIKFTKSYLKDLIETAHMFLKLLEHFCSNRNIVVQKRTVSRRQKKIRKSNMTAQETAPTQSPEELWDEVGPQISTVLQSNQNIPDDVIPFDATSDRSMDVQKVDAMCKIQTFLRSQQFEEAIGLLRAAREVWPENDCFGNANMAPEEEFMAIRDIFMANIQNADHDQTPVTAEAMQVNEEEEDEEEEQAANISVAEQDFKFMDFARRFAHFRVVQACSLLLKQFEKNLPHTNHCIAKMLHRIAWDCKLPSMLFQASLFRTFQRILDSILEKDKELAKFAVFIVRKFTEVASTNSKVYMELLFWKTPRDAYDIEQGYGSYQEMTHSSKKAWSEEEEQELCRLYQEFTNKMGLEDGNSGEDMVDWIMQNLINTSRSHQGVRKKLRELGYNVVTKSSRKSGNVRPPKVWAEEEELQLRELYEEFKIANDPLGCIIDHLKVRRPKRRVTEKLLEMGLIQDGKELRKKRVKKSKHNAFPDASGWESAASDESDSDEESDSDNDLDGGAANVTPAVRITLPQQKQQGRNRSYKKPGATRKKETRKQYSSAELITFLNEIISAGMTEAVRWVSLSLEEVADDREADDEENSIPLVPLSEEATTAMENTQFLKLLTALGLCPPSDEQEVYWRIPGSFSVQDLRKRVEVIGQALDGSYIAQDNSEGIVEDTGSGQDGNLNISNCTGSEEAEISNKCRKKKKRQNEQKNNTSDCKNKNLTRRDSRGTRIDSDSDMDEVCLNSLARTVENPHLESCISSTSTSKVKNVVVDSDFETGEKSLCSLIQEGNISDAKKSMTNGSFRNFLFDSDSENEDVGVRPQENKYRSKRVLSGSDTDSDSTSHFKKSRATLSVDDSNTVGTELQHVDEETNGAIYLQKHKRRIIVSDEEDD